MLLAATNRPEILDPALLRPGRFDRQVLVDRPDKIGREAILKVHMKSVQIEEGLDVEKIAAMTPGMVGADLANLINEAALLAVRRGKKIVGMAEFEEAVERVVAGLEKKNRLINAEEKKIVAYPSLKIHKEASYEIEHLYGAIILFEREYWPPLDRFISEHRGWALRGEKRDFNNEIWRFIPSGERGRL